MTIDALRAGLELEEVELELAHRATGRDLSGFVHRGRQLRDLLLATLAPEAMNFRGLRLPLVGAVVGLAAPSVAPVAAWFDKVSKRTIAGVTTLQIYRGAVAFIVLQSVMIVVTLVFPELSITDLGPAVDPSTIEIELPPLGGTDEAQPELPPLDLGQPPPEINPQ